MDDILTRLENPRFVHVADGPYGRAKVDYDHIQLGRDLADAAHEIRKLRRLLKAQVY